jgi:hypothetical protein
MITAFKKWEPKVFSERPFTASTSIKGVWRFKQLVVTLLLD